VRSPNWFDRGDRRCAARHRAATRWTNTGNQIGMLAANVGPSGSVSVTNAAKSRDRDCRRHRRVNAGTLTILDTGAVTQSAAITATNLALLAAVAAIC